MTGQIFRIELNGTSQEAAGAQWRAFLQPHLSYSRIGDGILRIDSKQLKIRNLGFVVLAGSKIALGLL